jgi:hypothetical protein
VLQRRCNRVRPARDKRDLRGHVSLRAFRLALQADGALLVAGSYQPSVLTPWLAPGGVVLHHDPVGWNSALQDVALLPDGSALAAGYVGYNSALARYTPCGWVPLAVRRLGALPAAPVGPTAA